MSTLELWLAAAEQPDREDWHPRPRYTGKCTSCGRFIPNAGHWLRSDMLTGETVELGTCGRCGTVEVE